jgi:hypothetical protein
MAEQSSPQQAKRKAVERKAKRKAVKKKAKEEALEKKAIEEALEKKAKEEALEKKAIEEALEKKAKEKAIEKKAKEEAIEKLDSSSIVNPGTKKRTASTHEPSDRPQKTRKRTASARVDKGAEDVGTQLDRTSATKRTASHSGLMEQGPTIYAPDMEAQIAAEARGVTRKNIPWDTFHSTYLCDFSVEAQSKLDAESVKKIGDGGWEEKLVWKRLRKVLSAKVHYSGSLLYVSQSSVNFLNRFFVTLSYSMAAPRLYPMLIRLRRCLLNPTSFSTSVKGLLRGQM